MSSRLNRKVVFWALATLVGIVAAANMKLYLLTTVRIASPSRVMEILATRSDPRRRRSRCTTSSARSPPRRKP